MYNVQARGKIPFGDVCDGIVFNLAFLKNPGRMVGVPELMDPDQVFVSDYWRSILEIPRK